MPRLSISNNAIEVPENLFGKESFECYGGFI